MSGTARKPSASPISAKAASQANTPASAAAMRIASELKQGVVVTMLCDSAAKYLSESFWRESLNNNDAEIWP